MTLITRVPGTPDTTLPKVLPQFGIQVDHFWHPRGYVAGAAAWVDEIGGIQLPVLGTAADIAIETLASGRPILHTKTTAGFQASTLSGGSDEMRTVFLLAKPVTGDTQTGATYVLNVAQAGIFQDVTLDTATTVPSTSSVPAPRDKWHLYSISSPTSRLFEYAIDTETRLLTTAAVDDNIALRIAGNATNKRELRIAAAFTSKQVYTAAYIAANVLPAVKAWYSEMF